MIKRIEAIQKMRKTCVNKKALPAMVICWTAVGIWSAMMMYFSLQQGADTAALSRGITEWLARWLSVRGRPADFERLHLALRTAAHVVVFLGLGFLSQAAVMASAKAVRLNVRAATVVSLATGILLAVVSEVLKIWIDGRHLDWGEALINAVSVCAGAAALALVWRLLRLIQSGRNRQADADDHGKNR